MGLSLARDAVWKPPSVMRFSYRWQLSRTCSKRPSEESQPLPRKMHLLPRKMHLLPPALAAACLAK
jgi:hypothetical protein